MRGTRWTETEDALLRELDTMRVDRVEIARRLGRTRAAVSARAKLIGSIQRPRRLMVTDASLGLLCFWDSAGCWFVRIDPVDMPLARGRQWRTYALRRSPRYRTVEASEARRTVHLAREILGLRHGDQRQADHINLDTLDNRRCNLRIVTPAQQQQNRRAYHGLKRVGTSRHRGVFQVRGGRWRARVYKDGKPYECGFFADEDEAARAVEAKRREILPFSSN